MASRKCEFHIYFTFLQDFSHPHIRKHLIFFRIIYVTMSNSQISALGNDKILAIHISTKVSFKITIRKTHVYIDIGWPWIWNQYFYLGIWSDDLTKIIFLPSFQLATRLNSQNRNETEFMNELWHFNLYMNSEIFTTRCNNCVYSSQWLYSTYFGWQFHPSSGVKCCIWHLR